MKTAVKNEVIVVVNFTSLKEWLKAAQNFADFVRDASKELEAKIKGEKLIIENTILFASISKKIVFVLHIAQQELVRWFHTT